MAKQRKKQQINVLQSLLAAIEKNPRKLVDRLLENIVDTVRAVDRVMGLAVALKNAIKTNTAKLEPVQTDVWYTVIYGNGLVCRVYHTLEDAFDTPIGPAKNSGWLECTWIREFTNGPMDCGYCHSGVIRVNHTHWRGTDIDDVIGDDGQTYHGVPVAVETQWIIRHVNGKTRAEVYRALWINNSAAKPAFAIEIVDENGKQLMGKIVEPQTFKRMLLTWQDIQVAEHAVTLLDDIHNERWDRVFRVSREN